MPLWKNPYWRLMGDGIILIPLSGLLTLFSTGCSTSRDPFSLEMKRAVERLRNENLEIREAGFRWILDQSVKDPERVLACLPESDADPEVQAALVRLRPAVPAERLFRRALENAERACHAEGRAVDLRCVRALAEAFASPPDTRGFPGYRPRMSRNPSLLSAIEDWMPSRRAEVTAFLRVLLRHEDPQVRRDAVCLAFLFHQFHQAPSLIEETLAMAHDDDGGVRILVRAGSERRKDDPAFQALGTRSSVRGLPPKD